MKKIIPLLLAAIMALSLTACGKTAGRPVYQEESPPQSVPQTSEAVHKEDDSIEVVNNHDNTAIPAAVHNGVSSDNLATPLLEDIWSIPVKEQYRFMKDGAVYSNTIVIAMESLLKPYSLGDMDGALLIEFVGAMDSAVTAENVIQSNVISFYYRGVDETQFNQVITAFEEYGVESWHNNKQPNWESLTTANTAYDYSGSFDYDGKPHGVWISLSTAKVGTDGMNDDFNAALGDSWPQLTIEVRCYG